MFQKYQPKKPPLNPFEEEEEENEEGLAESNPFKEEVPKTNKNSATSNNSAIKKTSDNSAVSKNPFEEEKPKADTVLDLLNPFNEEDDSPAVSPSEKQHRYKKKKAPSAPNKLPPVNKGKSQTLPVQSKTETGDNAAAKNRLSLPLKSPKKKAPAPERPLYEGTPPPSPEEKRRSRPITPPGTEPDTDSSMASTPSSV